VNGELILYTTEDGQARVQLRAEGGTVWLTQLEMAELFQTTKQNISFHIGNVIAEGELSVEATVKDHLTVQNEGSRQVRRLTKYYNLDMILAVGYRARSHRGTQFRQWATTHLRELLVKGFALDDRRLKQAGGGSYFDELLARIRDIRSSEKLFYKKVLEIYATSVDYTPQAEASQRFFATVQNKMHWAAHGHTAAEIVEQRADATRPNMGLTSWAGQKPRKADVAIAKNYLGPEELDTLNRIVTLYLDFAELQALNRRAMYMKDWIAKLDDFLRISDREILGHSGTVSHAAALEKAEAEFEKYRQATLLEGSAVEKDFEAVVGRLNVLAREKAPSSKRVPAAKT
jgi:hypothetical protein